MGVGCIFLFAYFYNHEPFWRLFKLKSLKHCTRLVQQYFCPFNLSEFTFGDLIRSECPSGKLGQFSELPAQLCRARMPSEWGNCLKRGKLSIDVKIWFREYATGTTASSLDRYRAFIDVTYFMKATTNSFQKISRVCGGVCVCVSIVKQIFCFQFSKKLGQGEEFTGTKLCQPKAYPAICIFYALRVYYYYYYYGGCNALHCNGKKSAANFRQFGAGLPDTFRKTW